MYYRPYCVISFILIATLVLTSCTGQTITQTITETQTQKETVTKTQEVEVAKTVYITENQGESPTTTSTNSGNATTTPAYDPQILDGYTTYRSEGLFSISYPSDWDVLNYIIEDFEILVDNVSWSIDAGVDLPGAVNIFFAGLTSDIDWQPNVNIFVETLPFSASSITEVVDAEVLGIQKFFDTYIEISREYIEIDGRDGATLYWEGTSGVEHFNSFHAFTLIEDVVWIFTFTPPLGEFYLWEEDFYNITDSFHYLK